MARAYRCDLCRELFEGCPPEAPTVLCGETQIKIYDPAGRFVTANGRQLEACAACQAQVLRLMAAELGAEVHE